MTFEVIKPGLFTTIQDRGRKGYQQYGVPIGGALDQKAYDLANILVDNELSEPCLEITLSGPKLLFTSEAKISITGANLSPTINGQLIAINKCHKIKNGDILSFGRPVSGCRSYLAIAGKWEVPTWLSSVSPLSYGDAPSNSSSILSKGQLVQINTNLSEKLTISVNPPNYHNVLAVLAGPEFDRFDHVSIAKFFSTEYIVSNESNRMGLRIDGAPISVPEYDMISSAVIPGTIQINKDGVPIIVHRDGQTTGGYHRIGILSNESLDHAAQLRPGDQIRFRFISYGGGLDEL